VRTLGETELYRGARSPIQSIQFNSTADSFVVGERGGTVRIWKLIRGEEAQGYEPRRDRIFDDVRAETSDAIGGVGGRLEDVWLDPAGEVVAAIGEPSTVRVWKQRGAVRLSDRRIAGEELRWLTAIELNNGAESKGSVERHKLLVTLSRENRLYFWCLNPPRLRLTDPELVQKVAVNPVASTGPMIESPVGMEGSVSGNVLWVIGRKAEVVAVNVGALTGGNKALRDRARLCDRAS
jgi:WD40 repeat protein